MNGIGTVVNILGAAALLLWGLRMVGTGVTRAFGAGLRRWINVGSANRGSALATGLVATVALQSSTATCLMVASFAGGGLMEGAAAQSVMLGANVGTALVTKLLSFDVSGLSALLILGGVVLYRSGEGRPRHVARILVGLGLILLSLRLLDLASVPLRDAPQTQHVFENLDGAPLAGFLLAALLAMLAHSSIASILMILPLAAKGAFSLSFGIALMLGANLGSAIPPVLESAQWKPAARRVPLGNALVRLTGCVAGLVMLDQIAGVMMSVADQAVVQLVDFHLAFNILLAALFLPLTGVMAALTKRLRPDLAVGEAPEQPRYLDDALLETPSVAIGAAVRETLRIGDQVEDMLRRGLEALRTDDIRATAEIGRMDNVVDALHQSVKLYLARLSNEDLGDQERRRANDVMTFVINLEHIGDIVDRNLKELVEKKIKLRLTFSDEGLAELAALFTHTQENLKLAMAVFVSGDVKMARRLVEEKAEIRALEKLATESHLSRISGGRRESIETSTLHLDILRDLKRINAHIASVAYPILEQRGELGDTRLRDATG